ncbi:hypothetical protein [Nocardia sp. NPDC057227]|uniref:hypothetical protein n=1 Tax=Nocardia sp. NPDC057227 TaxID=3346056 RepID=UPI003644FAED
MSEGQGEASDSSRNRLAQALRDLREWLIERLRAGDDHPPRADELPTDAAALAAGRNPSHLRAALARFAVDNRLSAGLPADHIAIWIETSGLRGVRTSVTECARQRRLSARQIHRRIFEVDTAMASLLMRESAIGAALPEVGPPLPAPDWDELFELLRAEAMTAPDALRAVDAVTSYRRNRRGEATAKAGGYLDTAKDKRFRDTRRVEAWARTAVQNPPVAALTPAEGELLVRCQGVSLAEDPRTALDNIDHALATQQRHSLPLLLAHAGRLLPDANAAGVDSWLRYLQLRFHAAMESEHISALRFARALQADAARLVGPGDPRVRTGLAGRAHILQMFGHYAAATRCYTALIRHAAHFPASDGHQKQRIHDAYAQIANTQALASGDLSLAERCLGRAAGIADELVDDLEVQFAFLRRRIEVRLVREVGRAEIALVGRPRTEARLADDLLQLRSIAEGLGKSNRSLAISDLLMLFAVATRDAGAAERARDEFQHVTDRIGGFANLTFRFNARLDTARELDARFADIAPVTGPEDALRTALGTPPLATGLLTTRTRA